MRSSILNFVPVKRRARYSARNGTVRAYTDAATKAEERAVAAAYKGAKYECPVRLRVDVFRALPKSKPRRVANEPDVLKPDLDNVVKAIMDGLNGVAYIDDSQVVEIVARKHPRTRKPGDSVRFTVEPMED